MSRYSGASSYGHWCKDIGQGDYKIGWIFDRYYADSRLRFPQHRSRITDIKGAKRFCKRWGLNYPISTLKNILTE